MRARVTAWTAVLTSVVLLGLAGCDTKDAPSDRSGPPADDLAPNGGEICPAVLPLAPDDESGFGTDEPATGRPDPGDFTRAWVCTYGLETSGPEWVRHRRPVPVPDVELLRLHEVLAGLRPQPAGRMCVMDLGPRRLVVTLRGGTDLTGYAVDQFGCGDVRITDDPATNPLGEAHEPGTVAGVLTSDRALLTFALGQVRAAS